MRHKKEDIIAFIVAAVAGHLAEVMDGAFGAWQYGDSSFVGIPIWLPLLLGFP